VQAAGVVAIIIVVAALALMYHFAKAPSRPRARAHRYVVRIGHENVDLDALNAQAFAALLSEQRGNPGTLKLIEQTIITSIQEGRHKVAVPGIPPTAEIKVQYSPRLAQRLERLLLLEEQSAEVDPAAYFELALYQFYRERKAAANAEKASNPEFTFGTAYGFLGVTGVDRGEYSVPFQLFSKVVETTADQPDQAKKALRALALGNLGLIYRARGDYRIASALLSEADELLTPLGFATESQQIKRYREIVRLESTSQARE